ncbi:hypothetical protein [Pseudoduganella violaceinigra]|uniref:hypothetical protein n=1 Tax=Pseudoduganella violaceinigra TaxID=246602 RepID=UPI000413DD86|nr:hypothetical protein [Pseudoduganella violaceinigra]
MTPARPPPLRSFRLRIALITTGLAVGVIAVLFVASALTVLARRAGILDRMMAAHLSGPGFGTNAAAVLPSIDAHLNASFSGFAPLESTEHFAIVRVVDDSGGVLVQLGVNTTCRKPS